MHSSLSSLLVLDMAKLSSLLVVIFLLVLLNPSAAFYKSCNFNAIYQFGDSISDTGNLIREFPIGTSSAFSRLPYGESFFNKATGRCSDGLLMIDYFALGVDLPFLNPYLMKDADFKHGVNFAVAGSTALDTSILRKMEVISLVTNSSLTVQLDWFKSYLNLTCSSPTECQQKLEPSLFLIEIGGNDHTYAFFQGKSMEDLQNLVPQVVQSIKNAAKEIIGLGARRIVIPGNFPIGCFPIYLTGFKSNDSSSYDHFKCLKNLNEFAKLHNNQLQQAIQELNNKHPDAIVVYADYYNAFQSVFRHAQKLGFDSNSTQKACCGVGGDYNFNILKMCGAEGVTVCENPNKRISWDGIHLTQKSYRYMAEWLICSIMPKIQCII